MDKISPEKRSWTMSQVKNSNTNPEKRVRSLLHSLGYRFRLYDKKLPGNPDIVLNKYKSAIFVHGCFWHRHEGCKKSTTPKSNTEYWSKKFIDNVYRDKSNIEDLINLGWSVLIIWECETSDMKTLQHTIENFLSAR